MSFILEQTEGRAVQRTPLVWAYELQAQRDELLRLLRNLTGLAATRGHLHEYSAAVKEAQEYIAKVEATK